MAAAASKRPQGRPSKYTTPLADRICRRLVAHNGSLVSMLQRDAKLPSPATVWRWMDAHPKFREQITRAKEQQAERMQGEAFEDLTELIADTVGDDLAAGIRPTLDSQGNVVLPVDSKLLGVLVTQRTNAFNAAVKLAGQMAPRVYGPKMELTHATDDDLAERLDRLQQVAAKHDESKRRRRASKGRDTDG